MVIVWNGFLAREATKIYRKNTDHRRKCRIPPTIWLLSSPCRSVAIEGNQIACRLLSTGTPSVVSTNWFPREGLEKAQGRRSFARSFVFHHQRRWWCPHARWFYAESLFKRKSLCRRKATGVERNSDIEIANWQHILTARRERYSFWTMNYVSSGTG